MHWKVSHTEGSIEYHPTTGFIKVKRKGYYFIYSQMYYYDGSTMLMGHYTCINNKNVMGSAGSVISSYRKYNTKYHGGVFLLQENDTISVRIPYTTRYYMDSESSFFGAFLLGDLAPRGKIDPQGVLGPPGPIGPPGHQAISQQGPVGESIYLVGDGTSLSNPLSNLITNWVVRNKLGSIHYDRGFITVIKDGHYFIYSQMYYHDARTYVMAHHTYINNELVLESVGSTITDNTKFNTKYHGGVFLLKTNDTISVRIPYIRHYSMKSSASFFGAFLLYSGESN
ncbi:ectodysplasin-A-like isoform X1 [Stylophora pistillata]|uniref:ectodysplasin-A-like isoform X1 n=1 Tax=Stylophora pistillata TaxID=50429 RepID=UPI000C0549C9|nr:ectodysplasin-A-like isoform X1 [Stylophora pistillata]